MFCMSVYNLPVYSRDRAVTNIFALASEKCCIAGRYATQMGAIYLKINPLKRRS
jgi:hypothetical protein